MISLPQPRTLKEMLENPQPRVPSLWGPFVLTGFPNLLYGDGGAGKTFLDLHIAVSVASGKPIFGIVPHEARPRPVFVLLAEDDEGETLARLQAICKAYSIDPEPLPLTIWCLPGHDVVMVAITREGSVDRTKFDAEMTPYFEKTKGGLIILDTQSDISLLDENDRLHVNSFAKRYLAAKCREHDVTIILNAHPSKASMESGAMYSGTTAWNNGFRSRNFLIHPEGTPKEQRRLVVGKANYREQEALDLIFVPGPDADSAPTMKLLTPDDKAKEERRRRDLVKEAVRKITDDGSIRITERESSGSWTPADLAEHLAEEWETQMPVKEVKKHLKKLCGLRELRYVPKIGREPVRGWVVTEAVPAQVAEKPTAPMTDRIYELIKEGMTRGQVAEAAEKENIAKKTATYDALKRLLIEGAVSEKEDGTLWFPAMAAQ